MSDAVGRANCPKCGIVIIRNIKNIIINIPQGISAPTATIMCESCGSGFLASVTWESALIWDAKGCIVNGFSRRTAPQLEENEIDFYMDNFDLILEEFLDIIDAEQKGTD